MASSQACNRPVAEGQEREAATLNIGEAARRAGVSARMIRHYEMLGLLGGISRSDGGYRQYSPKDVHTLLFIRRARDLGFSMPQIAELLSLWHLRMRSNADVRRIAQGHLLELQTRIDALKSMHQTLAHLVSVCHGDERPDCPILQDLAQHHD